MTVRAVLFDLDGVLVFSKEVWFELIKAAAAHFGAAPASRAQFEGAWGQGIHADVEQFFPKSTLAEVEAFYHTHFLDHVAHIGVEPNAAPVFAALHKAGVATAVVTNTPAGSAATMLAHAGLKPHTVVGGTDVPHAKPAPDMVLLALKTLAISPPEALMVGDTRFDREAAQAAGVPFVGYRLPGPDNIEELEEILAHAGV
ncbi:MAG: HAD family hydrolase [bacterium]